MSLSGPYTESEIKVGGVFESLDSIEWFRESEAYCFDNEKFAEGYLKLIFDCAVAELTPRLKPGQGQNVVVQILEEIISVAVKIADGSDRSDGTDSKSSLQDSILPKKSSTSSFSGWPSISEFNIKLGLEKVEEYVETWERSSEWMCCVEFLGFESEECSNYFVYEVEFSIPTPTYPIPQATASVYFSLEVSKIVPHTHDRPVDVRYIFEAGNVIHYPGRMAFHEFWLRQIIRCKLKLYRFLTF